MLNRIDLIRETKAILIMWMYRAITREQKNDALAYAVYRFNTGQTNLFDNVEREGEKRD